MVILFLLTPATSFILFYTITATHLLEVIISLSLSLPPSFSSFLSLPLSLSLSLFEVYTLYAFSTRKNSLFI